MKTAIIFLLATYLAPVLIAGTIACKVQGKKALLAFALSLVICFLLSKCGVIIFAFLYGFTNSVFQLNLNFDGMVVMYLGLLLSMIISYLVANRVSQWAVK